MPARKPLPLWIVVSLFVVSIAAVPLTRRLLRGPSIPLSPVEELITLLSRCPLPLYVVPQFEGKPECGVWVCTTPRCREQVEGLPRIYEAKYAQRWRGVVYCQKIAYWSDIAEKQLADWGEYGMRLGSLLFFGDPVLLQHIHYAILGHQRNKGG